MTRADPAQVKIGDLFFRSLFGATVSTRPCVHCGAPVVFASGTWIHFEVDVNGARTAWIDCYAIVRGRRKSTGTTAAAT